MKVHTSRQILGLLVREVWTEWCRERQAQGHEVPDHHLVPFEQCPPHVQEVDMRIGGCAAAVGYADALEAVVAKLRSEHERKAKAYTSSVENAREAADVYNVELHTIAGCIGMVEAMLQELETQQPELPPGAVPSWSGLIKSRDAFEEFIHLVSARADAQSRDAYLARSREWLEFQGADWAWSGGGQMPCTVCRHGTIQLLGFVIDHLPQVDSETGQMVGSSPCGFVWVCEGCSQKHGQRILPVVMAAMNSSRS